MISSLFFLYATVLVPIYSEWIRKEDLCSLDTAVCCQELRNRFLDLLTLCHCTDLVIDGTKPFDWMLMRGLRIKKLWISHSTSIEALILSRLLFLRVDLDQLVLYLEQIQLNVTDIMVHMAYSFDLSQLKIVGPVITDMSFYLCDDMTMRTIAACCPNLRKVSASNQSFILPLVDACHLETINDCHLGSLIKREVCEWTYSCNLKRTSANETSVCLGEEKCYQIIALWCWYNMTEKDADLLIPLMVNLTYLSIDGKQSFTIASAAVKKCRYLTELDVLNNVNLRELRQLLLRSPLLRRLNVHFFNNTLNVDRCISSIPDSCPLLEICTLRRCIVESKSAMSALFRKSHYLTEFSADVWPVDEVLLFAVNIDTLVVDKELLVRKSGRGLRKLKMPNRVDKRVLCALFAQNSGLRSVQIVGWPTELSCEIESMVHCCPMLTSVDVTIDHVNQEGTSLVALGRLLHLSSLSVRHMKGFTAESLVAMLENKSKYLISLSLIDCRITGEKLGVIGRLCPALTSLDLSGNKDIKNSDIVNLLNFCTKLEVYQCRPDSVEY